MGYFPPHCHGYEVGETPPGFKIPCGRGLEGANKFLWLRLVLLLIPIIFMMVPLGMIYQAVRKQEKKLEKYGVGALRANLQQSTNIDTTGGDLQQGSLWTRLRTSLAAFASSLINAKAPVTRSNKNAQSQSRAVMHKAFGYFFAWLLCWGF